MKKNLVINIDSGNIGHSFNDHQFMCFSYYLENKNLIDNVYIIISCLDHKDIELINNSFEENCLLEGKKAIDVNISFSILFFMFENQKKNIIFLKELPNDIINPIILNKAILRNVNKSNNFIEVYKKFRNNFENYLYLKNKKNTRCDITFIYRENNNSSTSKNNEYKKKYPGGGRAIINIEKFIEICNQLKISYKVFNLSDYYNFETIFSLFYFSNTIVSFHGCELTFGIGMNDNTTIIELTKEGHREHWWIAMSLSYTTYGLNYHVLPLVLDKNCNLNLNNNNINEILKLSSINK